MTTRAIRPVAGPETMTYWNEIIAQTARLDLPPTEHTSPTARGTMMNKIFVIRLRRGEPVDARELGDNGAPSVVFADPEQVYADILAEKLNPFWQVQNGVLPVRDFAANFLFSKAPGRFYCGPLLYFRKDTPIPLQNPRVMGAADWEVFKQSVARPLADPPADAAPAIDGLLMQRVLSIRCQDGAITQVCEFNSEDGRPLLWEPGQAIWNDLAAGRLQPSRFIPTLFAHLEHFTITLFYVKDREHIGYEFGLR